MNSSGASRAQLGHERRAHPFSLGRIASATLLAALALLGGRAAAADVSASASADDPPPAGKPWPRLERRTVVSKDGTRIAYWAGGRGATALILVHGWSCNHRFFGPQLSVLAASYHVVALDLAGHGESELRRGPVTVERFADDVEAVAQREARGPFILVVHSTGGRVASAAAPRLGGRLLGVVGIDTFQNLGRSPPTEEQIAARLAAQHRDFVADTRSYVATFFQPGTDPALVKWVERQMTATNPDAAIAATEAFSRFDATAALKGWPRPVIAINSDWVPTDYRAIRRVVPGFDLVLLPGRGHFPNLDDPEAFNPILLATIQRIEAAAAREKRN